MRPTTPMLVLVATGTCQAQSLFLTPPPTGQIMGMEPGAQLAGVSMIAVRPPEPRTFAQHDLITIIIDENTSQSAEQTLDTKKKVDESSTLNASLDLQHLLTDGTLTSNLQGVALLDLIADRRYKGEGDFERKDKFQGRITAEVVDVKPNGNVVIEARSTVDKDGEVISMVASGVCRGEDVTEQNTILSSQLANKMLITRHEGDVKTSSKKGWITRAIETVFAF